MEGCRQGGVECDRAGRRGAGRRRSETRRVVQQLAASTRAPRLGWAARKGARCGASGMSRGHVPRERHARAGCRSSGRVAPPLFCSSLQKPPPRTQRAGPVAANTALVACRAAQPWLRRHVGQLFLLNNETGLRQQASRGAEPELGQKRRTTVPGNLCIRAGLTCIGHVLDANWGQGSPLRMTVVLSCCC